MERARRRGKRALISLAVSNQFNHLTHARVQPIETAQRLANSL